MAVLIAAAQSHVADEVARLIANRGREPIHYEDLSAPLPDAAVELVVTAGLHIAEVSQLAAALRRTPGGVHAVVIAIAPEGLPPEAFLAAGADDVLAGPLDVEELRLRLAVAERRVSSIDPYLDLVENAHDAIYTVDRHGIITSLNPAGAEILGVSREAAIGQGAARLIAPELVEALRGRADALADPANSRSQTTIIRPDGSRRIVESETHMVIRGGRMVGFQGVARDITERREMEDQLALQAKILADVSTPVMVGDGENGLTYWNAAAERLFGWTPQDVLGRNPLELLIPDEYQEISRENLRRMAEGGSPAMEMELLHKDGSRVPVFVTSTPIRNPEGEIVRVASIAVDLTETRRAEVQEARLAAIVDSSNDAIIGRDANGTIISWNAAAERLFGYTAEEVIGKQESIFPGEGLQALSLARDTLLGRRGETQRRRKDGSLVDVEMELFPVVTREGKTIGYAGISRDITERKQREAEIARLAAVVASDDAAVTLRDLDFRVISWNAGAERLFGYTAEEAMGSLPDLTMLPGTFDLARTQELMDSGGTELRHTLRRHKDGQILHVEFRGFPVFDQQGVLAGYASVSRDISTRLAAEADQARLAAIANSSNEAIILRDLEGRVISWNAAAERLYGYTAEEAMGTTLSLIADPEDENPTEVFDRLMKGDSSAGRVLRRRRKDGSTITVQLNGFPVRDANGEVVAIAGITRDVGADLENAADAARLAAIVSSSDDAIVARDLDFRVISWNKGAERLYGVPAERVLGKGLEDLEPVARAELGDDFRRTQQGETVAREIVRKRPDGTVVRIEYRAFPVLAADGSVLNYAAILRDVTETRRIEAKTLELAAIVESSTEAVLARDLDGLIISWNSAAEGLYGYTAAEAMGTGPELLAMPEDPIYQDFRKDVVRLLGTVRRIERRRRKDGSVVEVELRTFPVKNAAGEVVAIAGVSHDVAPEREAIEAISRMATIIDSSPSAIVSRDMNLKITSWNKGAEALYGYTAEEALGQGADFPAPVDDPTQPARMAATLDGRTWSAIIRRRHKDGRTLLVHNTGFPIRNRETGQMTGIASIGRDITEERAHELERLTLATVIDDAPLAVIVRGTDLKITGWNKGAEALYGYTPDEALGRGPDLLVPDGGEAVAADRMKRALAGERWTNEVLRRRKDGSLVLVQHTGFPIRDLESGEVVGVASISRDVTAERAAEEERQALASIVESSNDAVIGRDLDGVVTSWNAAAERLYGYTKGEALGQPGTFPEPANEQNHSRFPYHSLRAGEPRVEREFMRQHKDGHLIEVEMDAFPVRSDRGEVIGYAGFSRDASVRKAELAELARLAAVVQNSHESVVCRDLEGRIIFMNPAAEQILGLKASETVGRPTADALANEEERQAAAERWVKLVAGESILGHESIFTRPDGTAIHVEVDSYPVRDASGMVIAVASVSRDVTARLKEQEAVAFVAGIVDASQDAVVTTDQAGKILTWNRGAEEMLGVPAAEAIGRTLVEIDPYASEEMVRDTLGRVFAGERVSYEIERRSRTGRRLHLAVATFPLRDASGEVSAAASFVRDVTEWKLSEAALTRALAEREVIVHLRDALAGASTEVQVYYAAIAALCEAFRTDRAVIRLEAPDFPSEWQLQHSAGFAPEHFAHLREVPPHEWIELREPGNYIIEVHLADRPAFLQVMRNAGVVQAVLAPIDLGGWRLGRLGAYFTEEREVDEQHLELARTISAQVGVALDRLRADQARRESEELMRLTFESADIGLAVSDDEGRIAQVNAGYCEIFGYSREELIGQRFTITVPEEDRAAVFAYYQEHLAGLHDAAPGEMVGQRKDGTHVLVSLSSAIFERGGRHFGVTTFKDITSVRATEERAERLGRILSRTPNAIFLIDAETLQFLDANASGSEQSGYSVEEIRELQPMDLVIDSSEETFRAATAALHTGEVDQVRIERVCRRRDGSTFPIDILLMLSNAESRPIYIAIVEDITGRKAAEAAIEERDAYLRTILKDAPIILFAIDREGIYTHTSGAGLAKLGSYPGRVLGQSIFHVFAGNQTVLDSVRAALAGHAVVTEVELNGVPWESRITPTFDADGNVMGAIGVSTDVSERKRTEQAMRQAQKLESLGVLAGGIAHDFNNLLVGILGNAGLAIAELPPGSPSVETLRDIETAGQRAAELARQMLAYSGKGRFVIQELNLNTVVQEMTHLLHSSIGKNVQLSYELAEALPLVDADATQIRQVVMNLVVNASDAIGAAPGVISLRTATIHASRQYLSEAYLAPDLAEGDYVYLDVTDNGSGMDERTLSRIFDPFFTTKFTGRGLGLAAVLGIVRGHHGAIKVESEVGQGTTFRLLLPVAAPSAEAAAVPAAPVTPARWVGSGTVLVVDDEATVRRVTARALKMFGFDVAEAEDGQVAVELVEADPSGYVAVLLDLTMPRMNGEETFTRIHELAPDLPVVLMSGYSEQDASERFEGTGVAGFIQKPYELSVLRQTLRSILEPGA